MARAVLFFFVSPVWAAWWFALVLAAAEVPGDHHYCPPKPCGNWTISAPFWLDDSETVGAYCGWPVFQVHCLHNTPYLGYSQRGFGLQILDIFYGNHSLLVSDMLKLGDFNNSSGKGCHVPTGETASKVGWPFSISTLNQELIFYNCTKAPTPAVSGLVETVCRNNTFVRAGGRYNETDGYALEGCNATFVPVLGASGKVNASDYEELISDGFLLTWPRPHSKLTRQINLCFQVPRTRLVYNDVDTIWCPLIERSKMIKSYDKPYVVLPNRGGC